MNVKRTPTQILVDLKSDRQLKVHEARKKYDVALAELQTIQDCIDLIEVEDTNGKK